MNSEKQLNSGINPELYRKLEARKAKKAQDDLQRQEKAALEHERNIKRCKAYRIEVNKRKTSTKLIAKYRVVVQFALWMVGFFFGEGLLQILFQTADFSMFKTLFFLYSLSYATASKIAGNDICNIAGKKHSVSWRNIAQVVAFLTILAFCTTYYHTYNERNAADMFEAFVVALVVGCVSPFIVGRILAKIDYSLRTDHDDETQESKATGTFMSLVSGYYFWVLITEFASLQAFFKPFESLYHFIWRPFGYPDEASIIIEFIMKLIPSA